MIENDEDLILVLESMASKTSGLSSTERQACELSISAVKLLQKLIGVIKDARDDQKGEENG